MLAINKKGMFFEIGLVLFAVIILSTSFYNIITSEGITTKIGKASSEIIELDKETKFKLSLVEDASLFYIYKSIIDLTGNSGYNKNQLKNCETWNKREECILDQKIIQDNLNYYLYQNFNKLVKDLSLNYYSIDVFVENDNLFISFNSPSIKIEKNKIEYYTSHNFQKKVNYDLKAIQKLYDTYSDEINLIKCPDQDERSSKTNEKLTKSGLTCKEEPEFLTFEYVKDSLYLNDPSNSFEYPLKPVIKFKLDK